MVQNVNNWTKISKRAAHPLMRRRLLEKELQNSNNMQSFFDPQKCYVY